MWIFRLLITLFLSTSILLAGGKEIAARLNLSASSKAIKQWEKVFKKERKMKRYGIDKLSEEEKAELKKYLIDHAADSDHPEAAGM